MTSLLAALVLLGGALWLSVQLEPEGEVLAGRAHAADGDTLRLGDERIRLLSIDAPERDQVCWRKDGSEWPCGRAAASRLAELVSQGPVRCTQDGRDKYDRLLATCRLNDIDLAALLVSEGLAVADWAYKAEENAARSARLGLWSGRFDMPSDWREVGNARKGRWSPLDWLDSWLGH